ncbi:MAG: hypothetical protein COA58_05345 [Bacteroidetes bacterium]|nr:MAG: hypothetical protein COA58_05345 [Bacteroidota bacterium]
MKKYIVIILTNLTILSNAQLPSFEPLYPRAIPNEGRAVPYRYLGESRVKYSKRIHRVIDSRMKQNKDITWPRNPLNQVIWHAVTQGYPDMDKPKAYGNDSLASFISKKEILEKVTYTTEVPIPNPDNPDDVYDMITTTVTVPFDPASIDKFRIMEDWIFDSQHSDLRPKIIAIAPMYHIMSESGVDLGESELFWVKMDDLRPILAQQEIFNKHNDAARLSYDHWFQMRLFDSHIVKESNVYDLNINQLEGFRDDGVEALLEADKIKNDLFVMEHDLWEY